MSDAKNLKACVIGLGSMGLDNARVDVVPTASAGNCRMRKNRGRHILDGDCLPRRAVDISAKVRSIQTGIAREPKLPTPVAFMAQQMVGMTAAAGMGRKGDASVARMIAGLDLPDVI